MAVAGVEHRDAGAEVDVATAFDVPQLGVLRALGVDRKADADAARRGGDAAGVDLRRWPGLPAAATLADSVWVWVFMVSSQSSPAWARMA